MKKLILISILFALEVTTYSQAPNAFSYQAILRNSDGTVKANEAIALQINIVNELGGSVYFEIHNTTTNVLGLVNLVLGEGVTSNDLSSVDWANGPYFIDVSVNGVNMGSSPLMSVPYALYAASGNEGPQGPPGPEGMPGDTKWSDASNGITFNDGYVGIGTENPTATLDVDGDLHVSGDIMVDGLGGEDPVISVSELIDLLNQQGIIPNNFAGTVEDIDGNVYKIVQIGDQMWMAENLRVSRFNDGTPLQFMDEIIIFLNNQVPSYAWQEGSRLNIEYGALYFDLWREPDKNLCPSGWHVSTDEDWSAMEDFLGGRALAGGKLKESGTSHWAAENYGATNLSGFTALPAGCVRYDGGGPGSFGTTGTAGFWRAPVADFGPGDLFTNTIRSIQHDQLEVIRMTPVNEWELIMATIIGTSIRCVKD